MEFKDQFESYIQQLDCTAKELSIASGLSAATLSRYRSGERIPEADSKNLDNLIRGIVQIAQEKHIPEITMESVSLAFSPVVKSSTSDIQKLQNNLHTLLTMFSVNVSELARFLNYDASYISRIRNGQRQPANPQEFALGIARFISRRYQSDSDHAMIAELTGCIKEDLLKPEIFLCLFSTFLYFRASQPISIYVFCTFPLFFPL